MFDAADDRIYRANNPKQDDISSNNQNTNTKIMPSSNKRRAAVASSFALFLTTLGLVAFIEIDNLHLPSYLQSEYTQQQVNITEIDYSFQQFADQSEEENEYQLVMEKFARLSRLYSNISTPQIIQEQEERHQKLNWRSPACHPHFHHLTSNFTWSWSEASQFKRIYFYHTRKAGGTSLAHYFSGVADYYGLEFDQGEWIEAEEPGTHELPTFYVTHLREPVARSISHFKYQGRWDCRDLIKIRHNGNFTATEDNAMKIDTWNATGGHVPSTCSHNRFKLGSCAVDCYIQWFSGACPEHHTTISQQYQAAMVKLLRYNFIVVLEKMNDPDYVSAVEKLFGVPGFDGHHSAYCERASRTANNMVPLVIKNDTIENLIELNEVDIRLYNELTDCLDNEVNGTRYNFPVFDADRFDVQRNRAKSKRKGRKRDKRKKRTQNT